MASQLRLTGTAGGNTILNGNDTIAADQTFEFPNTGGTLLTGSQTDTGSGGSSGSAKVVGYQQGTWLPELSDSSAGQNTATWGAFSLRQGEWFRIGQMVTIYGIVRAQNTNNVSTAGISTTIRNFPYGCDPSSTYSTCNIGQMNKLNVADNAPVTMYVDSPRSYCVLSIRSANNSPAVFAPSAFTQDDSGLIFTATYKTSDTGWTPFNGATVS